MPQTLWPASTVHLARVREDVVVLDLANDAYACLLDAAVWLEITSDGRLEITDDEAAAALKVSGLARSEPPPARRAWIPARRAITPAGRAARLDCLAAAAALAEGSWRFRGRSLGALVALAAHNDASRGPARGGLERRVAAHAAALPWIPFEGECLQRGFQLRRWLGRHGHAPAWVFGVRTWPFGAHCWVQVEDVVVGDTLERVGNYTPILVV